MKRTFIILIIVILLISIVKLTDSNRFRTTQQQSQSIEISAEATIPKSPTVLTTRQPLPSFVVPTPNAIPTVQGYPINEETLPTIDLRPYQIAHSEITATPTVSEPTISSPQISDSSIELLGNDLPVTPMSDIPAAGICAYAENGYLTIILEEYDLSPRCGKVRPNDRIQIINRSTNFHDIQFANYHIHLSPNSDIMIQKDAGDYLEFGVHQLSLTNQVRSMSIWLVQN